MHDLSINDITVVIPTLCRGEILIDTILSLQKNEMKCKIIVIDQTQNYPVEIEKKIQALNDERAIIWVRKKEASITKAMNDGLILADSKIVLFLDDDVLIEPGLLSAHLKNYSDETVAAVAGQVIQPWQSKQETLPNKWKNGIWTDLDFQFNGTTRQFVNNCMAGNFSVRRSTAIKSGGFDENFIGSAHRFETEFCRRISRAGYKIVFEPNASIRHLKISNGGIRVHGKKIEGYDPAHYIGEYYFACLESKGVERIIYIIYRIFLSIRNKYHLFHPWKIPQKLYQQFISLKTAITLYQKRIGSLDNG